MNALAKTLREAALEYATRGWYVFPLIPGDKKPLIADYYNLSTIDHEQIKAWWRTTPTANIGLDLGKSGLAAIDVDAKHAPTSFNALAGIMRLTGGRSAWETYEQETASGGKHYLFLAPEVGRAANRAGAFGVPGLDGKAKGGFVVLAPSQTPKGAYRAKEGPLRPYPKRLILPDIAPRDAAGRTELEGLLLDGVRIRDGARQQFLLALAGRLRRMGLEPIEIMAVLREAYALRCEQTPDFGEADLFKIAAFVPNWKIEEDLVDSRVLSESIVGKYNDTDKSLAISAYDLLNAEEEDVEWLLDGILPFSSVNMLSGPPKAGKSTLSKHLVMCVATGALFLGRYGVTKGPVLVYTLQENKPHVREWLTKGLGVGAEAAPIDFIFHLGKRGDYAVQGLRERIKEEGYRLIVIDMFRSFSGLEDIYDYALVEQFTTDLYDVALETKACVLWLHHENKGGRNFDAATGSQALRGSVYTTMRAWKEGEGAAEVRCIATEQRLHKPDGGDLAPQTVVLDKKTNTLRATGELNAIARALKAAVRANKDDNDDELS
jgi:archaellum biogenesis ATPase FlaH